MRIAHPLGSGLLALSLVLTSACLKKKMSNCTKPQAAAREPLAEVKEVPGGILESSMYLHEDNAVAAEGGQQEKRFCSAVVEPGGAANRLRVWTSRHCLRIHLVTRTVLHLDTEQGYRAVEIELEPVRQAELARKAARTFADTTLRRDFVRLFSRQLYAPALNAIKASHPELARNPCNEKLPEDTTSICSLLTDLVAMDARLAADATLPPEISSRLAAWRGANAPAGHAARWAPLHARLTSAHDALTRAHAFDALKTCTGTPHPLCGARTQLEALFAEFAFGPPAAGNALEAATEEYAAAIGGISDFFADFSSSRQSGGISLQVLGNFRDQAGSQRYGAISETALSNQTLEFQYDVTAVRLRIPQAHERVTFAAGDSGTVFAFEQSGAYSPFFSLHYLDRRPVSDGFALSDLPPPRPRTSDGDPCK